MSPDPVNPQIKVSPAVVPAPSSGTVLPPAGPHKIVFRDRSDAEGVAKIYYSECKTVDLKTGKEASVADLAKRMEKDLDMANGRYNSSHKGAEVQKNPFDREAFTKKWLKDHVGDGQVTHDGETKSATQFINDYRKLVNGKTAVETPALLDATALHFKDNRKVKIESLQEFFTKSIEKVGDEFKLKHDIKVDDERRGTVHAGVLHLKGRSGAGLPGGSITLGTDDKKWGTESERVFVAEEIKSKKK